MDRLADIEDWITSLLADFDFPLVIVEGYAFCAHASHAHELGELGGVVRMHLYREGFAYLDVAPASLKKFVTGKGNAKKDEMMLHIYKRWGVDTKNSDEADAYGLARIGLALLARETGCEGHLLAYERAALAKLRLPGSLEVS